MSLEDGRFESRDHAKTGYEFSQTRGVLILDTAVDGEPAPGIVAVAPVGMAHVASVNLTTVPGTRVAKGDEFGFFAFGGSDSSSCSNGALSLKSMPPMDYVWSAPRWRNASP